METFLPNCISYGEGMRGEGGGERGRRGLCHRSEGSRVKMCSPGNFCIFGGLRLNIAVMKGGEPFSGPLLGCHSLS